MTKSEFWKSLDIKNDARTYLNFCKLPLIILIRVPLVLLMWFFIWFGEYLENLEIDFIPGWERK